MTRAVQQLMNMQGGPGPVGHTEFRAQYSMRSLSLVQTMQA